MGKKSDSITSTFAQRMKDEAARQKEEKKAKGPFAARALSFIKVWGARAFHVAFFASVIYFILLFCMMIIPTTMAYVVGGLNYNLNNSAEYMLAMFSGLFFTAWVFVGTYKIISLMSKVFVRNWKRAGGKDVAEKDANNK